MSETTHGDLKSRHSTAEPIAINARDVLAGHYDNVRLEAGR